MLSYKEHFKSQRPDGRHTSTIAAQMASFRAHKKELAIPTAPTREEYSAWQKAVKTKLLTLLAMPPFTNQPAPVKLSEVQRDGYRVEKWELYPDDFTAVPFLALIPDGASPAAPVPAVLCCLGSNHCKEMAAGEPLPEHPNYSETRFYDRNQMAKHLVKEGMAAFVFDNPGIGETALPTDPAHGETQFYIRTQFCHGYLDMGMNYVGVSVFQKLCFMDHLRTLDYVDHGKIGICSHSLGTETAIAVGLLCDDVKAVVFNDFLCDDLRRYVSITEEKELEMSQNIGNWHLMPGRLRYFGFPELCAAFAPRYLALSEGGADEFIDRVKEAYALYDASDHLLVSYYPEFRDPESRTVHEPIPDQGLTKHDFYYRYSYCVSSDHSFRKEPAIRLFQKAFDL